MNAFVIIILFGICQNRHENFPPSPGAAIMFGYLVKSIAIFKTIWIKLSLFYKFGANNFSFFSSQLYMFVLFIISNMAFLNVYCLNNICNWDIFLFLLKTIPCAIKVVTSKYVLTWKKAVVPSSVEEWLCNRLSIDSNTVFNIFNSELNRCML